MAADARHLVVGRLRKPHGLKGEIAIFPLTDTPDVGFEPGRQVWIMDLGGEVVNNKPAEFDTFIPNCGARPRGRRF